MTGPSAPRVRVGGREAAWSDLLASASRPAVALFDLDGTLRHETAWLPGAGLGDDPAKVFLVEGRVALARGLDFGPGGEGHVRVNYATRSDVLREALARMGEVAAGHRG